MPEFTLLRACKSGVVEEAKDALRNGASPMKKAGRESLLYTAGSHGHFDIAHLLVRAGAVLDERIGPLHDTILHKAAQEGNYGLCSFLLAEGSPIDCVNDRHQTPLYLASKTENNYLVRKLLESSANVNHADNHGNTPLHAAARFGRVANCDSLIQHGAALGLRNKHGKTPIQLAAKHDQLAAIKLLHGKGAHLSDSPDSQMVFDFTIHSNQFHQQQADECPKRIVANHGY